MINLFLFTFSIKALLEQVHFMLISWVTKAIINVGIDCIRVPVSTALGVSKAGTFTSISFTIKGLQFYSGVLPVEGHMDFT